jgi:hypothetical protein
VRVFDSVRQLSNNSVFSTTCEGVKGRLERSSNKALTVEGMALVVISRLLLQSIVDALCWWQNVSSGFSVSYTVLSRDMAP